MAFSQDLLSNRHTTAPSDAAETPLKHLCIIDGSGFIFRAFHALPPLTRPDGAPINAVYGFTTMLSKFLGDDSADHIVVAFDAQRHTFRNAIYPEYKAHRAEAPPELIPQFALIRQACQAFNIPAVEMVGYEADDLIATYTRQALQYGARVTIISSDKDLMQLVSDHVIMLDPLKNRVITEAEVKEKFGVAPTCVRDVLALVGDSSDNVPGVPGIGMKTATELIQTFGSLESLYKRLEEIHQPKRRAALREHEKDARLSLTLVTLKEDVEAPLPLSALSKRRPDPEALKRFLLEQNFTSLLSRFERQGFTEAPTSSPQSVEASQSMGSSPSKPSSYEHVKTLDQLQQWITDAYEQGWIAVDTETTSLNPMQADLVGIALALGPGKACYIPLAHKKDAPQKDIFNHSSTHSGKLEQLPISKALESLKPLLEDSSVLKIGHNLKYDLVVLSHYNIDMKPYDDTIVMSYILDGTLHGHSLDDLAALHFGHAAIAYKDVTVNLPKGATFDYVPIDQACAYAGEDADITVQLYALLKERLVKEHLCSVYETIDRPLISALVSMERAGVKVDVARLNQLSADFAVRLSALASQIHHLVGRPFNVGSPKQVGEILFDEMGMHGSKKGKAGAYSTSADILEDLALEGNEVAERILEWRQLSKLKSTYTDALTQQMNPKTGRVHTSFSLTTTLTGRLSSSHPNLQNIPVRSEEGRKIRSAFIAEKGHKLISLDYSQIELRLLAHVAPIDSLRQAFINGADIHKMTASEVFGLPLEEIDSTLRSRAKAINFGIIYGMSAFGLANQLKIPQAAAADYIARYFQKYPGIQDYMKRMKENARAHGYVETLFGRRCTLPEINSRNPARRNFAERQAINAPLQGTAADIIKRAMIYVPSALAQAGLKTRLLLQVHDELILEAPEAEAEATVPVVRQVMENAAHLSVPLAVDAVIGNSWAEKG